MKRSTRTMLTTGVAALSVGALVTTGSVPPQALRTVLGVRPAALTTDVDPHTSRASIRPVSEAELETASALIEQLAPVANGRLVTVRLGSDDEPATVTVAPSMFQDGAVPDESPDALADAPALDGPAPLNVASNIIDDVYSVTRYWANYVSLELGPWLINWVPFGYLVSDQIYIWYPNFVLPVVDSFVYDFLDPVVNDPLNLGVWIDGIGDIISTAATGVYNGIVSEIDYVLSFGWFPIPLPPLPDFPLPGLASVSTPATTALAAIGDDPEATDVTAGSAATDDTEEDATEPVGTDTDGGLTEESPAEDGTEDAGDGAAAPAQRTKDAQVPVDDLDEVDGVEDVEGSDGLDTDESPAEISDENAPSDSADESGDTDPSGDKGGSDGESGPGTKSGDNTGTDAGSSDSDD